MDATGTDQAVLVSLSKGAQRALLLAADHPERVLVAAFIGPFFPASPFGAALADHGPSKAAPRVLHPAPNRGWLKFNGAHWRADYPDFVEGWMR